MREMYFNVLRFKPGQASGGFKEAFESISAFIGVMRQIVTTFFAPLIFIIKQLYNIVGNFVSGISWLSDFAEKHKLNVHAKILVGYVQVLSSFATFNVKWPKGLSLVMNDVGSFFQFNFVQLPGLSCLWANVKFQTHLLVMTIGPLVFVGLCGFPLVVCKIAASLRGWTPERLEIWESLLDRFYGNVLFAAFLLYPIVSKECLQAFNCHQTLDVLYSDFTMECPPLFSFLGLYSVMCVFLYPLGIPYLFYSLMVKMKIPRIADDKKITAAFFDMVALFNTMNATLECKLIAQIIGKIDDVNEFARRIEDMYR